MPEAGGPKILMVTRRFWPLTDDSAGRLVSFAEGLRRAGIQPTIQAARYASSWPAELSFRELNMVRPLAAPRSDWSLGLYLRGLNRWLREHAREYDLLYVDAMRDEAATVVNAGRAQSIPVVVRCGGTGQAGDWIWALAGRGNRKAFNHSLRADRLIAPTPAAARGLITAGADRGRVLRINDGVPPPIRRERTDCLTARAMLAAVNSDLRVPSDGKVVLINASFQPANRLPMIADAIAPLCERRRELRVWFVGDGTGREGLHHQLCDLGVRGVTALPGSFWHIEELVCAADVIVVPADHESFEHRLPMAISAAVPTLVVDSPETRAFFAEAIEAGETVTTLRGDDPIEFRNRLDDLLSHLPDAEQRAVRLRNVMRRKLSREKTIESYSRVFASLMPDMYRNRYGTIEETA